MFTVLLFFAGMCVASVVFTGWVIASIARFAGRMAGAALGIRSRAQILASSPRCPQIRCQQVNPAGAHFCRRCGAAIAPPASVSQNRAVA